jgi:hypothetical protein
MAEMQCNLMTFSWIILQTSDNPLTAARSDEIVIAQQIQYGA